MNKEKILKTISIIILSIILVVSIVVIYINLATSEGGNNKSHIISVYYLNPLTNNIEPETRNIKGDDTVAILRTVLNELREGPKNSSFVRSIPASVGIKDVLLNDDIAEVNFSEEYNDMSIVEEIFCRSALVWTLTELDFINSVIINVESEPLKKSSNQEMGLLNRDNIVINPDISSDMGNTTKMVTLYFSDNYGLWLVPEERRIEVTPPEFSAEKHVVEQLIKGTEDENHHSLIPPDTKVRSVKTEESICYVDLSTEFIEKQSGSSTEAILAVYSIVNSLTEIAGVKQVVFHIEGQRIPETKIGIDLSLPLNPDPSMIEGYEQ